MNADKPEYRVPLMTEIAAAPWNGLTVASTFAGCGGSSTGYRMAGYRVLWANEFVEAARDSYAANKAEYTVLDGRDIRDITPEAVLEGIGLGVGELDVLDGSPPCASFSTAGKRHKHWGAVKKYSDKSQRTDDLFFEFIRILDGVRPRAFVAENVSGLVKGAAKGYFKMILRAMKECGYRVEARLLDAQWLGVPQHRQRIIFVGVREDLGLDPRHPVPLPYRYSVTDACPGIAKVQCNSSYKLRMKSAKANPSPTICAQLGGGGSGFVIDGDDPAPPDMEKYAIGEEWDNIPPGGQSKKYFQLTKADPDKPCATVTASGGTASIAGVTHPYEKRKFTIPELRRICGFPDDFKLTGTYAQQWERLGRSVPPVMMRSVAEVVAEILGGAK